MYTGYNDSLACDEICPGSLCRSHWHWHSAATRAFLGIVRNENCHDYDHLFWGVN